MPEQGDIVLIPVPFTDLSAQKRRPVIVISNKAYNRAARLRGQLPLAVPNS
jgi:mRNA interferase MazF